MLINMMPNTTTDSTGMTTTKIRAAFTSMVKAMAMAPNTMKGDLKKRRKNKLTPDCTWFASLVIRVINVAVPALSSSA